MNHLLELGAIQRATVQWDLRSMWNQAPHGLLWWMFLGLIAGWLAGKVSRGHGF